MNVTTRKEEKCVLYNKMIESATVIERQYRVLVIGQVLMKQMNLE